MRKYGPLDRPADVIRINQEIREEIMDLNSRKGVLKRLRASRYLWVLLNKRSALRRLGKANVGAMKGMAKQQFTKTANAGNERLVEIDQLNDDPYDNTID